MPTSIEPCSDAYDERKIIWIEVQDLHQDDFCLYFTCEEFQSHLTKIGSSQRLNRLNKKREIECSVRIVCKKEWREARAHICFCYRRQFLCATLRGKGNLLPIENSDIKKLRPGFVRPKPAAELKETFLYSIGLVTEKIAETMSFDRVGIGGLVLVCGSTASAKSSVATLLAKLASTWQGRRMPHLITYEDPIEEFLFGGPEGPPPSNVDYTPRQRLLDANSLETALLGAKRQTPRVFYIGEIRDDKEFLPVLDFGGTGHLVIATTHSSSVVECFKKLFVAKKVKTASDRRDVAARLRAVIHLAPVEVVDSSDQNPKSGLLPAMWWNTSVSVDNVVADGMASILPYTEPCGTVGRRYFADQLLDDSSDYAANLRKKATGMDIGGI